MSLSHSPDPPKSGDTVLLTYADVPVTYQTPTVEDDKGNPLEVHPTNDPHVFTVVIP